MYLILIPTSFAFIYLCAHAYYIYSWNYTPTNNNLRSSNYDDSYVLL